MKIFSFEIEIPDPASAFSRLSHLPFSLFIDSADQSHADAQFSYILANPLETIEAKGDTLTVSNREKLTTLRGKNPLEILKDRMQAHDFVTDPRPDLPPFQGGLAGLFGYDLGRSLETMPDTAIDNPDMPDMMVGLYDQVIAFDHKSGKSWLIIQTDNELIAHMKHAMILNNLSAPARSPYHIDMPVQWTPQFKPAAFKDRIAKAKDYILQGDIFQVNLAQKFEAILPPYFDAYAHYQSLRTLNPAPFAAFMNCGDVKIASCSPERFITSTPDGNVHTKPIKGTAPRHADPVKDAQSKEDLQRSAKDRAENIMITDLLRNDLSKVCDMHSIHVDKLCALESFANVHHLVSTITGQLREKQTPLDLMQACFPGGSVTGAPKIRAMEIIEELEPERRGPYCGSIALIGANGHMDSNILIRTLVYDGQRVSFRVGGGITASSDPDTEYQETLDKARGLFESFDIEAKDYKLAG